MPNPNLDTAAHPEFAQLVTHEDIDSIKNERIPFKILDEVDEFTDFLKTPDMQLDDAAFEKKYMQKYQFDLKKDALNYYATVQTKVDKEERREKILSKQNSRFSKAQPSYDQTR